MCLQKVIGAVHFFTAGRNRLWGGRGGVGGGDGGGRGARGPRSARGTRDTRITRITQSVQSTWTARSIQKTAVFEIFAVLGILGVVGGFEHTQELWKYIKHISLVREGNTSILLTYSGEKVNNIGLSVGIGRSY